MWSQTPVDKVGHNGLEGMAYSQLWHMNDGMGNTANSSLIPKSYQIKQGKWQ